LAKKAGTRATAGTPAEAASGSDVVILAVHWTRVEDVLAQAGKLTDVAYSRARNPELSYRFTRYPKNLGETAWRTIIVGAPELSVSIRRT
jgi:predicted dinucleotide-binding enzyme